MSFTIENREITMDFLKGLSDGFNSLTSALDATGDNDNDFSFS